MNTWTGSIEVEISETGDETSSVFSYSQLLLGQNENLGRELGILNSVSLLILGTILGFRSGANEIQVCVGFDCLRNRCDLRDLGCSDGDWGADDVQCSNELNSSSTSSDRC